VSTFGVFSQNQFGFLSLFQHDPMMAREGDVIEEEFSKMERETAGLSVTDESHFKSTNLNDPNTQNSSEQGPPEIDPSEIEIGEDLGVGSFGTLHLTTVDSTSL
jgi:hypothetical protein